MAYDIPLHRPDLRGGELTALTEVLRSAHLHGAGERLEPTEARLAARLGSRHAYLTSSCTHALELAVAALELGPGDEVLVPTWGFSTTATCALRVGADIGYVDSGLDDPNVDPDDFARRITPRTRALVLVHYAGVPCDMTAIEAIAREHDVDIIEDAAQAFDSRLAGRACGTLGRIGCISFHGTKNITSGEGGLFLTDDDDLVESTLIRREMGTDRFRLRRDDARFYAWQDVGSSLLPSELSVAVLGAQLDRADEILEERRRIVATYRKLFEAGLDSARVTWASVADDVDWNGHIVYLVFESEELRDLCRTALQAESIEASPHFHPLHRSPFGRRFVRDGAPPFPQAERYHRSLLRLPVFSELRESDQERIVDVITRVTTSARSSATPTIR